MITQFDGYILDFPGLTKNLALPVTTEPERDEALTTVADVIAAFHPLLRPLTVDLLLRAYHRETQMPLELAHPHWFATTLPIDRLHGIAPSTQKAIYREVDSLTPDKISLLIQEACTLESLSAEFVCVWSEIRIYAVEIRLPDALADREILSLGATDGDIGIAVERRSDGSWISSARSPGNESPIELTMFGELPKLRITTHWSLWMPGGVGESDLDRVIDTLLARGWIRSAEH